MLKSILLVISLFCISIMAGAQTLSYDLFTTQSYDYRAVRSSVDNAQLLKLNKEVFDEIFTSKPYKLNLSIPVENGTRANIQLERFEILTPDAKGTTTSSTGIDEFSLRNIVVSYMGKVNGLDNSFISLNFSLNGVNGVMVTDVERYVIGRMENMGQNDYLLFRESKLKMQNNFSCATSDEITDEMRRMMSNLDTDMDNMTTEIRQANIALDLDFATHNRFGSVNNATAYALSLFATSSVLYLREMNIKLNINYVNVWTTADPYTGSGSNDILNQFRSYWNSNHQSDQRTIAHLISTRAGGLGGIAWVNVLCASTSNGYGYAFSNTNGGFNQVPTYSWDVDVVSHEMGHNFGSPHTHSCSWPGGPIDTCYQVEGGCYSGPTHPIIGTIMSYCHLSAGKVLNFGTLPRNLIRTYAENAPCMNSLSQQVVVAFPNGGESFKTYTTTNIIWGSGFTGNVDIELTTNNGGSWSTIASNIPASQNEYIWNIPNMDTTQQAKIRILNSANASQGDTSDAVFTINENLTLIGISLVSPSHWSKIFTSQGDTSKVDFVWRKAGYHPSITYKWSFKKIGGTTEYFFPSNNSGNDTSLTVTKGFLDSLGRTVIGFTNDSVQCVWRSWAYNAYDSLASNIFIITIADNSVGINNIGQEIPGEFKLFNNYPNPFNPQTRIDFALAKDANVKLVVYDYLGRKVAALVNGRLNAGTYSADFKGSGLASGVYFYRLTADYSSGSYVETRRMMLIK
ncbi:MAG: T9SS type A sorting domain-containing protein [Ignavibacteriae bacterium]|nr:T9SS type A sorting domain-containing protein [Ignavibacteriota bacterium]